MTTSSPPSVQDRYRRQSSGWGLELVSYFKCPLEIEKTKGEAKNLFDFWEVVQFPVLYHICAVYFLSAYGNHLSAGIKVIDSIHYYRIRKAKTK